MSSPSTSEEVAADFKDCLADLHDNNRWAIENLTQIARENVEHAQAISRALEEHIKKTIPHRKLPALYVLDSIVKHVSSPYTIFLGRNLFTTFWDAYTLVDAKTRKSMESMLRTWAQPVPGSMDPTPVFPFDTTNVIEKALERAKKLQQNRQPAPPRPTPTPPHGFRSPVNIPAQVARPPSTQSWMPPPAQNDLTSLNNDIENLTASTRTEAAAKPYDTGVQGRLKALFDLQLVLRTQQLAPEPLNAIRAKVTSLTAEARPTTPLAFAPGVLEGLLKATSNSPKPNTPTIPQASVAPVAKAAAALPSGALAPGMLESLLRATANLPKANTPTPSYGSTPVPNNFPPPIPTGAPTQGMLDALRAAGFGAPGGSPVPPPVQQPYQPPPQVADPSVANLLKSLSSIPGFANIATPVPTGNGTLPVLNSKPRIPLSTASLKLDSSTVFATIYTSQPDQCPTCAMRFPATPKGKATKSAHLDWHFRVNQRRADAVNRIPTRESYPDEQIWLRLKELDLSTMTADDELRVQEEGVKKEAAEKKRTWMLAPGATSGVNKICPICQDAFVSEWSGEAQDWVWRDAVMRGGRAYHRSCLAEVTAASSAAAAVKTKPEAGAGGVLGKRKAVDCEYRSCVRNRV